MAIQIPQPYTSLNIPHWQTGETDQGLRALLQGANRLGEGISAPAEAQRDQDFKLAQLLKHATEQRATEEARREAAPAFAESVRKSMKLPQGASIQVNPETGAVHGGADPNVTLAKMREKAGQTNYSDVEKAFANNPNVRELQKKLGTYEDIIQSTHKGGVVQAAHLGPMQEVLAGLHQVTARGADPKLKIKLDSYMQQVATWKAKSGKIDDFPAIPKEFRGAIIEDALQKKDNLRNELETYNKQALQMRNPEVNLRQQDPAAAIRGRLDTIDNQWGYSKATSAEKKLPYKYGTELLPPTPEDPALAKQAAGVVGSAWESIFGKKQLKKLDVPGVVPSQSSAGPALDADLTKMTDDQIKEYIATHGGQ